MSREVGYYELKLMMMSESRQLKEVSVTEGLPKLRHKYRKVTGSQLRAMIAEDCGSAHKLGRFDDLVDTDVVPDEAYQTGDAVARKEDMSMGVDPTIPDMGADDGGRNLGNGGKSRMAREQLHHIAEYAVELWNLLDDEDEIPEWCQSKIAVMGDAISKVKHHLEYKVEKPDALSLNGVSGE